MHWHPFTALAVRAGTSQLWLDREQIATGIGDHDNYVHAKPARNISLKNNVYAAPSGVQYIIVVPRQAPELSRYNSFNDPNARENARNVVGARDRRQHPLGGSWVINPGTSGSGSGAASGSTPQRGSEQLMPNPYTGCGSGSSARTRNPNTDPAMMQAGQLKKEQELRRKASDC